MNSTPFSFRVPGKDSGSGEPPDQDDADLMARVRAGSMSALEQLLHLYWPPLVRYAAQQLGSVDVAKDVVQEVFIQVWWRRTEWKSLGSPKAYLYTMARSLVIDEQRRRRVRDRGLDRRRRDEPVSPPTPIQLLDEAEIQAAYEREIGSMPARRREVFDVVSRGLSHQEVASVIGISVQTVANHMVAALARLRRAIQSIMDADAPH